PRCRHRRDQPRGSILAVAAEPRQTAVMRRFLWLGLALLLAACAGQGVGHLAAPATLGNAVPPAAPPFQPVLTHQVLVASDGAHLPLRFWLPEDKPRAVILALHGFNDYSEAFALPAAQWAKDGIATYAYDQRGFGAAPERGASSRISTRRAGCCARGIRACRSIASARAWAARWWWRPRAAPPARPSPP